MGRYSIKGSLENHSWRLGDRGTASFRGLSLIPVDSMIPLSRVPRKYYRNLRKRRSFATFASLAHPIKRLSIAI